MLKGEAKKNYQRNYMRNRRKKQDVRPIELDPVRPTVPLYNPSIHRAGDRVMVYKGRQLIETVIPELDGDGNAIPKV